MALTLTKLQSITDYYVEKTPNDIYFKSNILLYKLLGGEKGTHTIPGGKKIQVILEYSGGNSDAYGSATKLPPEQDRDLQRGFLPLGGLLCRCDHRSR